MKDIEKIIHAVNRRLPDVQVTQNTKIHPADDDHLWWFELPAFANDVQIESADGNCPFWVETSSMKDASEALVLRSIDEVSEAICGYLESLRARDPAP